MNSINSFIDQDKYLVLENYLNKCVKEEVFPGANFALVLPNIIKRGSVGNRRNFPTVQANNLDTIYDLASLTKVVATTSCILKLIESGDLTLSTLVSDILIDFEEKSLTIKDLITHRSGLPIDINNYKLMNSKGELIKAALSAKCEVEPRTLVRYSDVNFILLGLLIDRITGSFTSYAHNMLFEPLEMHHTGFNPAADLKDTCAATEDIENRNGVIQGIVHDGKGFKLEGISGHAGLFSTIEDLSNFVQMIINDGVYKNKQIFSHNTINLLKKCQTTSLNEKRSIGWIISDEHYALGDYFSEHTLYHTGFSGPSIIIDLDKKIGFILLCNRVHPSRLNVKILNKRNNIHNLFYECIKEEI